MFTGLIEAIGVVCDARKLSGALELRVDLAGAARDVRVGDSIALSGVCCTVTDIRSAVAVFWLSTETLDRTWLGAITTGRKLNIERCLRAGDPMGGHIVQGHVDGVARVVQAVPLQGGTWQVEVPERLARYCVEKGSIALDGVSLTIARLQGHRIDVAVIPHTAAHTTIGETPAGSSVHVEVDVLAKYVERLLGARAASPR
jgi:riboflavin synthase